MGAILELSEKLWSGETTTDRRHPFAGLDAGEEVGEPLARHVEQLRPVETAVRLGAQAVDDPSGEAPDAGVPGADPLVPLQPQDLVDPFGELLGRRGLVECGGVGPQDAGRDGRVDGDDPVPEKHLVLAEPVAQLRQVEVTGEHGGAVP